MQDPSLEELDVQELKTLSEFVDERIRKSVESDNESERNADFVQLYRGGLKPMRQLIRSNPVSAQIFYFFLEHMDWGNSVACSSLVLEEVTGKSRSSVARGIRELKERGFIGTSRMGTTNVYHLNAKLVWSSWANGKRYAKLNATVVLSETEQEEALNSSLTRTVEIRRKGEVPEASEDE